MTGGAWAPYNGGMRRASAAVLLAAVTVAVAGCASSGSARRPAGHIAHPGTGHPTPRSSCRSHCTPANQPALDAAASYAERVAGDAHVFAGDRVDDTANTVIVYLANAPQSVIDQLRSRHPDVYVIHNGAPRTLHSVMTIAHEIDPTALKSKGIDVVEWGPTQDGYLRVGVTSQIARAQAYFDAKYGRGVVRVFHGEPATF